MKFRQLLACVALLSLSGSAFAARLIPDLKHLDAVPMHSLPVLSMQKAVSDAIVKNRPLQFAVSASLPLTLDDGAWTKLDDGSWSWRTRIFSSGAQTLNFEFAKFQMPANGELWIYDAAGERVDGPYTKDNENADGKLWTAVVLGDTAIIEARVPAASKDQLVLQIGQVHHGYRGFENASKALSGFSSAGACETNVACPAGANWPNEIRAVARIQIGGDFLCTGQLVNNVRQDDTPYFLTAYHCEVGQTTNTPASSVVFYWNYQFSQCANSSTAPNYQTQSGSTLIAGNPTADFTLIRLAQTPSSAANVYFSGWNASTSDVPQSGVVIHHPGGDVKKISTYSAAPSRVDAGLTLDDGSQRAITAWKVFYSQGVTEPGSSGSGLLNQNHQLVGQLSGGSSACNLLGGTNGQFDLYGRIDSGWAPTASGASSQLKANLDPDNTGQMSLSGKNPSSGSGGSGGGGAMPLLTLLGLAAAGLIRRRKNKT